MALDFQVEPFFDDYSEDKQFYKILFRPGYAVQARELNQLQTILSEQIKRHGDHIFKEGAMIIPGQIAYDLDVSYIKLVDASGLDYTAAFALIQDKIIQNSQGVLAKVVTSTGKEGNDASTIFVRYIASGIDNLGNSVAEFSEGDSLTLQDGTSLPVSLVVRDISGLDYPTGNASTASVQRGVYYIRGKFVLVPAQTIVLDKYSNTPSYRVGLQLSEEVVYPEDDETLLDNALGSPNYAAPGAARHYIDLVLTKLELDSDADTDFIDLLRLRNGTVLFKVTRTEYAELEKTLARRTYDESGDYALNPFNIKVREYRSNNRGRRESSIEYIQGDIVSVVNTDGININYYVCTAEGTSNSTPVSFSPNPELGYIQDGTTVRWEHVDRPIFNDGVYKFFSENTQFANFTLNDHKRLASMVAYSIEPNKAYVKGYEIEKIATEYLPAFKSRLIPEGSQYLASYLGVTTESLVEIDASVSEEKTASIDLSLGSYILATNLLHSPDLDNFSTVNLYDTAYTYGTIIDGSFTGTAANGTIIGTARVRGIEIHSNVSGVENDVYKVFLFDIKMIGTNKFNQVKALYTTSGFKCNPVSVDVNGDFILSAATLVNPENFSLIYPIPDYAVKDITSLDYTVVHKQVKTGDGSLTAPQGFVYESSAVIGNYYAIKNNTGIYDPDVVFIASGSELAISGTQAGVEYTIISTITTTDNASASTLVSIPTDFSDTFNLEVAAKPIDRVYTLSKSNVVRIVSVLMASVDEFQDPDPEAPLTVYSYTRNITDRFTFDNGQYETHYGNSTLRLKDSEAYPTGAIKITYEYISPSSDNASKLFTVDSYTHGSSNIAYDEVPIFKSYALRDSLDFRPYVSGAGLYGRNVPKFGRVAIVKYTKYLPRVDNLSLTDRGQYLVSYGFPSENPLEPTIPSNAMKLAIVDVEPYTFTTAYGLKVTRIDNKRYTMRDIGKLENRIKDLEYYTSLSLLEADTNNLKITDSDGLDRFQSGFLVDSFAGQGVGNTASQEWNASIDHKNRELRPFFAQRQISLLEVVNAGGNYEYKVSGDIISIPKDASNPEVAMITQAKASRDISVNPFDIATFRGIMYLNPWSDTWFATDRRPDIIINDEGQYNAVVAKAEADGVLGTIWNAWQVLFQGEPIITGSRLDVISSKAQGNAFAKIDTSILNANNNFGGSGTYWSPRDSFNPAELIAIGITDGRLNGTTASTDAAGSRVVTIETSAVELLRFRDGKKTFIEDKIDSRVVDDRVVETQIIPYIRPRAVLFNAKGLKPTTDVNAFFDGINVNKYIQKALVIEVLPISGKGYNFDVDRNCGTNVQQSARLVEMPAYGVGTVSVTNGSNAITGIGTAFLSEFPSSGVGLIIIGDDEYQVDTVSSDTALTLTSNYTGPTISGIAYSIRIPNVSNREVEVAFTHGEVITNTRGATAIVVGQEVHKVGAVDKYYLHILNRKTGTDGKNFLVNDVLTGEYTDTNGNFGLQPQVKYVIAPVDQRTVLSGGKVKTSYTGQLHGLFRIPNNPIDRFKTGVRELTFTSGDDSKTQGATDARAYYEANGLLEIRQRTIVSTRTANLAVEELAPEENRIIQTTDRLVRDTGWFDPLAQTFLVQEEGGAFLSSVDLFFSAKDENIPVRIEIREVVNGYPGQKVLPFSRVQKSPAEVLTSANGSIATKFTFVSPVYVQPYTEYAIVILSDSARYFVHISRSGDVGYDGNPISGQPYNGVFFLSQNASTWTASQLEDLKFVINKAKFKTGTYVAKFSVPRLPIKKLDFNPFYVKSGKSKIRVLHRNHGFKSGDKVVLYTRQHIESLGGFSASSIFGPQGNGKEHTVENPVEEDSYVINVAGQIANATGRMGGAYIYATEHYEYSTAMLDVTNVSIAGTDINYKLTTREKSNTVTSSTINITNKENYHFSSPKILRPDKEIDDIVLEAYMTTNNPNLSPIIDTGRISLTMVNNKVDYPTVHTVNDEELDTINLANANLNTNSPTGSSIQLVKSDSSNTNYDGIKVSTSYAEAYNNLSQLRIGSAVKFENDGSLIYYVAEKYTETSTLTLIFTTESLTETPSIPSGTGIAIDWLSHYNSEISPDGGSVTSKYVTKKINLSRSSDLLRIMFSALIPNEADVEVYYKTGQSIDSEFIGSRYYRAAPTSAYNKSDIKFNNLTFDVEGLDPFNSFVVKIVMKSTNTAKVPKIKDFRVIACAV